MNPYHAASAAQPTTVTFPPAAATTHPMGHNYHVLSLLLNGNQTAASTLLHQPLATPPHQQNEAQQQSVHSAKQHQEKQRAYVNALVDITVQAIASIWPNACNQPSAGNRPIANLNTFLHHILKHSRTTHSTLQLAIFYLFRIRPRVIEQRNIDNDTNHGNSGDVYIACGRRMFLAALICAHKFLQDKTYKNSAWSKVSGLSVAEVNHAERVMLQILDWSLYVRKDTYDRWIMMLQRHLKYPCPTSPAVASPAVSNHINAISTITTPTPTTSAADTTITTIPVAAAAAAAAAAVTVDFNNVTLPAIVNKIPNKSSATTLIHLGMPTPVEDGLSSPPHHKRKAEDDDPVFAPTQVAKRRAYVH